jgi:hypothetical protein
MMKEFIRENLRLNTLITEQMIDGQEMTPQLQSLCDTMSVRSYHEVLGRIISAIGHQDENQELWAKIKKPLDMLKQANFEINKEKHTTYDGNTTSSTDGMTGDSMADEANTWWTAIQSTLCEQGPEFQ